MIKGILITLRREEIKTKELAFLTSPPLERANNGVETAIGAPQAINKL